MASEPNSVLVDTYSNHIGEPRTSEEALGYWLFVIGVFLGIVGIVMFLMSEPANAVREWSIALGGLGLAFLLVGPVIRLPLKPAAKYMGYLGALICMVSVAWFFIVFPQNWNVNTGAPEVMALYSVGAGIIATAGVMVPMITKKPQQIEKEEDQERVEDELRQDISEAEKRAEMAEERTKDAEERTEAAEDERDVLMADFDALRESQARFELFEDEGGEYRWRLRHRNGNVIATCGEGYTARHNAQNGLESVRRNAFGAAVMRIEPTEEDESEEQIPEHDSQADFEVYEDKGEEYRWRLVHRNGTIIAISGEGYASRSGVKRAIESVKENVGPAEYLHMDPAAFQVYHDKGEEWRWRLIHRNGNILANSGEGYVSRPEARDAVNRVKERVGDDDAFELYEDERGEHRWRVQARNNEIIAISGEGYESKNGAEHSIEKAKEYIPEAHSLDIQKAAFEVYEDEGGDYRWRLRHRNGNIIATSGDSYSSKGKGEDGIDGVKRNSPDAEVVEPE